MELRSYLGILERRWLAIVMLPLVTLIAVIILDLDRSPHYTARARLSVTRISPETTTDDYEFDDYYDLLASDFILDDTVEIVRGNVFAASVAERLSEQGIVLDPETIDTALFASREHRILTVGATSMDHGLAVIIANMASIELQEDFQSYLGQADDPLPITIRPVDIPIDAESDTTRIRILYILAVIVAGGFGFLLALGLEFLDESLDADSAAHVLGSDVIGIVRERRG